eukprot:Awhi_evm1s2056
MLNVKANRQPRASLPCRLGARESMSTVRNGTARDDDHLAVPEGIKVPLSSSPSQNHFRRMSTASVGSRYQLHGFGQSNLEYPSADNVSFCGKLKHHLHNYYFHLVLMGLLIIDVLIVITAIILELLYLDTKVRDLEILLGMSIAGETLPDPIKYGTSILHEIEVYLAYISCTILSCFLLENLLLMIALGKDYFTSLFHIFDLFVVSLSLGLELAFLHSPVGGLIILGRLWRIVRLFHGFFEASRHEPELILKENLLDRAKRLNVLYHSLEEATDSEYPDAMANQMDRVMRIDPNLPGEILFLCGDYVRHTLPPHIIHKTKYNSRLPRESTDYVYNNGSENDFAFDAVSMKPDSQVDMTDVMKQSSLIFEKESSGSESEEKQDNNHKKSDTLNLQNIGNTRQVNSYIDIHIDHHDEIDSSDDEREQRIFI